MSSLELEAGKLELIREIVNINSSTALESLRKNMKEVMNNNSHYIPTEADSKLLTKRMLAKYAGSWKDNRDSDEINDDIYASDVIFSELKYTTSIHFSIAGSFQCVPFFLFRALTAF